jgi:DNA-binding NarL/FixJ family response regulator
MAMRLLLADAHVVVRQGVRVLLEQAGMGVIGEASGGPEALRLAQLPRSKPCFGSIKARKSYKCLIFHEELWPCI